MDLRALRSAAAPPPGAPAGGTPTGAAS